MTSSSIRETSNSLHRSDGCHQPSEPIQASLVEHTTQHILSPRHERFRRAMLEETPSPGLLQSQSDRFLTRIRKGRTNSCNLLTDLPLIAQKTSQAAVNSYVFLDLISPPNSPGRPSPRNVIHRVTSKFKASSSYADILFINVELREHTTVLKFEPANQELSEAIGILNQILNDSWDGYIKLLQKWQVDRSVIVKNENAIINLTDIHGENVNLTILKKLEEGGYHLSYLVRDENGVESVLLVAKNSVDSIHHNSIWTREQIESIVWRENTTQQLSTTESPFFPKHLHTFVFDHEISNQPCAGYLIEKLSPLETIDDKYSFCIKTIELLKKFHAMNMVHGDTKKANLLCTSQGEPRFIDLTDDNFVDFTAFKNMNHSDAENQWEKIRLASISSLFTPAAYNVRMLQHYKDRNIHGAFSLLKIKDNYGLALAIWEFLTGIKITEVEKKEEKALTFETFLKIKTSSEDSRIPEIIDWIIDSIEKGFT